MYNCSSQGYFTFKSLHKYYVDEVKCHFGYHGFTVAVLVAEVTQPSLGVGYEIGRAVAMNKRTLCLFRPESERREMLSVFPNSIIHFFPLGRPFSHD